MAGRLFEFGSYRTASVHDYANVLVPLEEAHDYSHAARTGRRSEYEAPPGEDEGNGADGEDDEDEDVETGSRTDLDNGERRKQTGTSRGNSDYNEDDNEASAASGMLPMRACEYSIEGLRRVVRQNPEGSKEGRRRWTDYECEFSLTYSTGKIRQLTGCSKIQTHQQGHPRYWHGLVQLAALLPVRIWLVRRQVSGQQSFMTSHGTCQIANQLLSFSPSHSLWMQVSRS